MAPRIGSALSEVEDPRRDGRCGDGEFEAAPRQAPRVSATKCCNGCRVWAGPSWCVNLPSRCTAARCASRHAARHQHNRAASARSPTHPAAPGHGARSGASETLQGSRRPASDVGVRSVARALKSGRGARARRGDQTRPHGAVAELRAPPPYSRTCVPSQRGPACARQHSERTRRAPPPCRDGSAASAARSASRARSPRRGQ